MSQIKARHRKVHPARVAKYAFLTLAAFLSAFPFYWMLVSATNSNQAIMEMRMLPGANLIENWKALTGNYKVGMAFFNSLRNATVTTLVALFVSSLAGYGFVVYRDKYKNMVMSLLMLSMMVPAAATLIPMFRMFSQLKLNNTLLGVMLPSISTAFLIFMFRQGTQTFPDAIIQAARIDGLGEFRIFLQMYMPIMKPTYAAAATVTFMNTWNAYLWPLVILQSPGQITMPILIANTMDVYVVDYGMVMLAVSICTIPTLLLFFALQKSFVEGILGSVK